MSKNLPTFATVNTLERHIEILLLSNDCVIVPGLGGFVAHHVCARYVPEEGLFLPPLRTVGFNAQLTMNDSLLAQAYAESADTSLPDALDAIEREVADLRATLDETGEADLPSLGRLYKNADGHLAFDPCEAGILTPSLYGLSSFEIRQLATAAASAQPAQAGVSPRLDASVVFDKPDMSDKPENAGPSERPASPEAPAVYISRDRRGHKALSISLRALRNTAAAAAVIAAMFLVPAPLAPDGSQKADIGSSAVVCRLRDTLGELVSPQPTAPRQQANARQTVARQDTVRHVTIRRVKPAGKVAVQPAPTSAVAKPAGKVAVKPTPTSTVAKPAATPAIQKTAQAAQKSWSIVLCSHVSQQGAEMFVQKLAKEGVSGAQVSNANGAMKVLYGHYASEAEARQALTGLRSNKNFQQAWVLEVK